MALIKMKSTHIFFTLFEGKVRSIALAGSLGDQPQLPGLDTSINFVSNVFVPWQQEKGLNNNKVVLVFDG